MALACMHTIVFTKRVRNRASTFNMVQRKDESLITADNDNDNDNNDNDNDNDNDNNDNDNVLLIMVCATGTVRCLGCPRTHLSALC